MTTIGYATLQIIPSLDGVSEAVDKQLGGKLRASGKAGGKQLAKGVGEGLKDLEREVDSASKSYDKLKDKAADALGKVRKEEAALQDLRDKGVTSGSRFVAVEERLATARRASNRANREAEDGHKGLLNAQSRLGAGSDDLGGRFGKLSGLAGVAGTALAGAGAIAGGAALAGIAALGAGVVVAGRQLYELGAQFDDLSDNLQIKTGLSGSALDQLKGSVERLGTTDVPDTFENIGNVAAEVTRNLHLTGQPLEDVTSRLANLQRMGIDVDVRALGKAFRGFGVDVDGQVPALNGLYEASTKSGLSIDDMLASVVKGGPALRALGLTFGESAALVTTFEDAGLDADKSIAGLTKGLANFSKDGKTGSAALRDAVTQIESLAKSGKEAAAIDLANKLFGAKGGVAFFDAIKSGALDLQSLSDSLSSTGQDINAVADDTADWSERWQTLKNEVAVALEPLAAGVFDGINEQLGNAADYITEHKDQIVGGFVAIADGSITMTEVVIKSTGLLAEGFGQLIAPIGDVLGGMNQFQAWQADIRGDHDTADTLREEAEGFFSWGEGLTAFGREAKNFNGDGLRDAIHATADEMKRASDNTDLLKTGITTLPDGKTIVIKDTTPENIQRVKDLGYAVTTLPDGQLAISVQYMYNGAPISLEQLKTPIRVPATPGGTVPTTGGGRATGGSITGPGGPKSDIIPIWASNGEHMWTAEEVNAIGGHGNMERLRAAVLGGTIGKFASGGAVSSGASQLKSIIESKYPVVANADAGRQDSYGEHASGNALDIMLGSDYKSAEKVGMGDSIAQFLLENAGVMNLKWVIWNDRIYKPGQAPAAYGNPSGGDDNSQHRNHVHAFLAGKGVKAPAFDSSQLLGGGGSSSFGGGSGSGGSGSSSIGIGPNGESGTYTAPDAKNVREADEKVADADQRVRQAELKIKELEADAKESQRQAAQAELDKAKREASDARADRDEVMKGKFTPSSSSTGTGSGSGSGIGSGSRGLSLSSSFSGFGSAIGEFAGGQIGSALGVFGVPDSPGWLQAASQLVGGISIGGGSSASPLSATPAGTGVIPPDNAGNVHGTRAGQQPGPVYNITARDTEDAFIRAQRVEREKAAAKLSRF